MSVRRSRWSFGIALAAVYMLVVQSVVGALAEGAGPQTLQLDAFGNPLCITSADHSDPVNGSGHSKMMDGCALACSLFSPGLAAPPEEASTSADFLTGSATPSPFSRDIRVPARNHSPGNPRAPPLSA